MKHLYLFAARLAGNTSRRVAATTVTLPYAVLRVLRPWVDELPAGLAVSAGIAEWTFGLLGLLFVLRHRFNKTSGD